MKLAVMMQVVVGFCCPWAKVALCAPLNKSIIRLILRQLAVKEWTDNAHRYEPFLCEGTDLKKEAKLFLNPSTFQGQLGDTMLTCLSNLLGIPIIVFSSMAYHTLFCVTPEVQLVSIPLMVAFNQYGQGHFDGVIPLPLQLGSSSNVENMTSCTCGKNDKSGGSHCSEIKYKYTTKISCPCLKAGEGCHAKCVCKNCSNNIAKRPPKTIVKRQRHKHQWQKHEITKSIAFAEKKQERVVTGPPTKLEYFILETILSYCSENELEANSDIISSIYNTHFLTASDQGLKLSPKSSSDIAKYLLHRRKSLATFAQLCTMQLKCTLQEAKQKAHHDDIIMDSADSGDDTDTDDEPRMKMPRRQ